MTESYLNCFHKDKLKKFLPIIDSNKFSHRNKIGEFNYTNIKDLIVLKIIQLLKYLLFLFHLMRLNIK